MMQFNKYRKFVLIFGLWLGCQTIGQASQNTVAQYQYKWNKNPDALYYMVIVEQFGKRFLFKAYNNYIYFKNKPSKIGVWVYDKNEKPIGRPKITQVNLKKKREIDAEKRKRLKAKKKNQQLASEAAAKKKMKGKEKKPAKTDPVLEKQNVEKIEREPTAEELRELQAISELEAEEDKAFSGDPFKIFMVHLGLGSEKIASKAGSSSFEGSSIAAPIDFDTTFHGPSMDGRSNFGARVGFRAHTFQIEQQIKESDSSESTSTISLSRVRAHISGQYYLFANKNTELTVELGWSLLQTATLTRQEEQSSNVELEQRNFFGPIIHSTISQRFSKKFGFHVDLGFLPMVTDETTRLTRFSATPMVRYHFFELVFLNAGMMWKSESLEFEISCNTAESCKESGTLSSDLTAIFAGIGIKF